MGRILDKVRGFFSRPKEENALTRVLSKSLQAVPDDYERFDGADSTGYRSNRINPSNEIADFLQLYQVNPHIYACVNAIATAIASVDFQILKNGVEVDKDNAVLKKMKQPNPHQTWYEFSEADTIFGELCGNSFWEEVRDESGELLALYLLRPDKMKIVPHPKIKIAGYIYEPRPGVEILYGRDEITHFKYFSPLDEYWGISPSYAAQNSIILDVYSTAYNKKFFQNSAVPEGVLETDLSLSDATYLRLRQDWMRKHKGVDRSFELAILEEGLKYKPIGFNQRDMQMMEQKNSAREEILSAYRVPPGVVGFLKYMNSGALREQKKMFYSDNIIPKLTRKQQVINAEIIPQGQGLELRFMIEKIQSLIEDIQVSTQVAMQLVTHAIMTVDEVREKLFGMKPVAWGKKPWIPTGLQQFGEEPLAGAGTGAPALPQSGGQAANESTPLGGSVPTDKPTPVNSPTNTAKRFADFEKIIRPEPNWSDRKAVRDWRRWNIWKGTVNPDYIEIRNLMKNFFEEQFKRVTSGLRSKYPAPTPEKLKTKKSLAIATAEEAWTEQYMIIKVDWEDDVNSMLFNITEESGKLKAKLLPKSKSIIKKSGKTTLGDLKVTADFNLDNDRVAKFLKENAGKQIDGITKKTRQMMGRELSKAIQNGEDFDDMMLRMNKVFKGDLSEWRARTIARTEVVTLTQFAALEAARQSGVVKKKRWVSELLDTTRDRPDGEDHRAMHDQEVDIDDVFNVPARKGEVNLMDGPGDPNADAENNVNCLCILDFPGSTPELDDIEGDVEDMDKIAKSSGGEPININVHVDRRVFNEGQKLPPIVHIHTPEQKAPIVKMSNEIKLPEQKAPTVHVHAAEQKAPVVKVNLPDNSRELVQAFEKRAEKPVIIKLEPKITVNAKLKMPKRKKRQEVHRDERTGRVTGTTETEETIDEEDENKGTD